MSRLYSDKGVRMFQTLYATAVPVESAVREVSTTADKLLHLLYLHGPKVLAALLIFFVGQMLARLAAKAVYKGTSRAGKGETLSKFFASLVNVVIMTFVVIAVINRLGIETTSFLAVFGAAGLAIGLALQGSLGNLASGVLLIIFRPFNIGDGVQIGAVVGTVHDMQIFSTIIQTAENKKVIIPNGKITGDIITNFTALGSRRMDLPFMVAPDADLNAIRATIRGVLDADPRVLKTPPYDIIVADWGDKVKLVVRPYSGSLDFETLQSDLIEKINLALRA